MRQEKGSSDSNNHNSVHVWLFQAPNVPNTHFTERFGETTKQKVQKYAGFIVYFLIKIMSFFYNEKPSLGGNDELLELHISKTLFCILSLPASGIEMRIIAANRFPNFTHQLHFLPFRTSRCLFCFSFIYHKHVHSL